VKRRGYAVSAAQAPALHVLIDQVAAATGNLRPDVVLLTRYPEISAVVVGLRSHRVLLLGLPILITLTAQERVALIGSALAQTTPARVRAARAIQPGLSLLRGVAVAFRPMCIREWAFPVRRPLSWWCWQFLGAPLWVPACLAHLVAVRLTAAERRRWQLRSDLVAMRASGTIGMLGALNELALWPHYAELVNGWVPPGEALPVWRKRIDAVRASRPADLDTLRAAANARDGSVRAGTLPIGHRYDFLVEQPYEAPQLLVAANHAARIDAELAPYAEALRRRLTDGYEPYVPPLRGAGSAAWTHRSVTGRLELFDRRPPRP